MQDIERNNNAVRGKRSREGGKRISKVANILMKNTRPSLFLHGVGGSEGGGILLFLMKTQCKKRELQNKTAGSLETDKKKNVHTR